MSALTISKVAGEEEANVYTLRRYYEDGSSRQLCATHSYHTAIDLARMLWGGGEGWVNISIAGIDLAAYSVDGLVEHGEYGVWQVLSHVAHGEGRNISRLTMAHGARKTHVTGDLLWSKDTEQFIFRPDGDVDSSHMSAPLTTYMAYGWTLYA